MTLLDNASTKLGICLASTLTLPACTCISFQGETQLPGLMHSMPLGLRHGAVTLPLDAIAHLYRGIASSSHLKAFVTSAFTIFQRRAM